jgi:hypothetical protein
MAVAPSLAEDGGKLSIIFTGKRKASREKGVRNRYWPVGYIK